MLRLRLRLVIGGGWGRRSFGSSGVGLLLFGSLWGWGCFICLGLCFGRFCGIGDFCGWRFRRCGETGWGRLEGVSGGRLRVGV